MYKTIKKHSISSARESTCDFRLLVPRYFVDSTPFSYPATIVTLQVQAASSEKKCMSKAASARNLKYCTSVPNCKVLGPQDRSLMELRNWFLGRIPSWLFPLYNPTSWLDITNMLTMKDNVPKATVALSVCHAVQYLGSGDTLLPLFCSA
jgi:hypothetical protein